MKKILFALSVIFFLSIVLSEHSRGVYTDSTGWYHYRVEHLIDNVNKHPDPFKQKFANWYNEIWKTKSNENEWHIYNPEKVQENKQGYRSWKLNSIDTLTYPNDGYYFIGSFAPIGREDVDIILSREIELIKSPHILDGFTGLLEDERTMTKFFIFCVIFCFIGYITALKRTKIDSDLIVIKGGWDYFWLALPYVMFITCLLLDVPFSGFMFLCILIPSIGLLVKSIMHNKGAENIFLSFISKIFVIIILVLIVFMFFGGTKKDGRFKDGTKGNQSTKNKVIAGGIAYGLILSLIHGSSAWKNEFKGKLKNNPPGDKETGNGKKISANGDVYVGERKDGKRHGQGTFTWADGNKYVGEWKDGKKHGQGTGTLASGSKYVGEWNDDKKHGQGTLTYASGNKYVGEWKDGKSHGQGTFTDASGDKYVGEWKDDKKHGQGTGTLADGTVLEGVWKDGDFIK